MVYLDVGGHVGHERFRKKASRKGVWGTRRRTFVLEAHLAAHLRDHTSHTSFFRGLRAATRSSYRGHAPPHIPHAVPKCPSLFGKRCASPAQCCPIGFRRSTLAAHARTCRQSVQDQCYSSTVKIRYPTPTYYTGSPVILPCSTIPMPQQC